MNTTHEKKTLRQLELVHYLFHMGLEVKRAKVFYLSQLVEKKQTLAEGIPLTLQK